MFVIVCLKLIAHHYVPPFSVLVEEKTSTSRRVGELSDSTHSSGGAAGAAAVAGEGD